MLHNHLHSDEYTTDKPLIYAVLVELYFTLGRALMAEKKYKLFASYYNNIREHRHKLFKGYSVVYVYHL